MRRWNYFRPARAVDSLRIGFQNTGTFAWQLDTIRRHGLAAAANLDLKTVELASPDAGKLALNGGTVDVAIVDWLWVARERSLGTKLKFYPYSSAVGAIMVKQDSSVARHCRSRGRTLSIAGGPLDKSWLIVRAAAMRKGLDLTRAATLQYGAPPLIFQKTLQGEADASLNYWNFCARLEGARLSPAVRCASGRNRAGFERADALTGYVFSEEFAATHDGTIERFLSVVKKANAILLQSDPEWEALRPLMQADDDATFLAYRDPHAGRIAAPFDRCGRSRCSGAVQDDRRRCRNPACRFG